MFQDAISRLHKGNWNLLRQSQNCWFLFTKIWKFAYCRRLKRNVWKYPLKNVKKEIECKKNPNGSIPATVLKQCVDVYLPFLTKSINHAITENSFPEQLKKLSYFITSKGGSWPHVSKWAYYHMDQRFLRG